MYVAALYRGHIIIDNLGSFWEYAIPQLFFLISCIFYTIFMCFTKSTIVSSNIDKWMAIELRILVDTVVGIVG